MNKTNNSTEWLLSFWYVGNRGTMTGISTTESMIGFPDKADPTC